jgi:hypothetical protein
MNVANSYRHMYNPCGRAIAQELSRRPLTAEARLRSQLYVGYLVYKVTLGQVFPRVLRFSPVSFIPQVFHYTKKRKTYSSSQGCTISLKAAVRL